MAFLSKLGLKQSNSKTTNTGRPVDYRHSLADRSEEGIVVVGLDGKLQFINGAWTTMHGYTNRDELIGMQIWQFYTRKFADDVARFIAQTKILGWYVASVEQLRRDGTSFPAQLKMVILKDQTAQPYAVLLIVADTSRISQMQKTIQQLNGEIGQLKDRISRLEDAIAGRHQKIAAYNDDQPNNSQPAVLLPVAELKQLAQMAKRFS